MKNKKQSSVEWLQEKIYMILAPIQITDKQKLLLSDAVKQAKSMHKDEILNAYTASGISMMSAEQFYEEYFNK